MMFRNPMPTVPGEVPERRHLCMLRGDCLTQTWQWPEFTCGKCAVRINDPKERVAAEASACKLLILTAYGRRPDGSYVEKKTISEKRRKRGVGEASKAVD